MKRALFALFLIGCGNPCELAVEEISKCSTPRCRNEWAMLCPGQKPLVECLNPCFAKGCKGTFCEITLYGDCHRTCKGR